MLDTSGFERGIVRAGQAIGNLRGQLRSLGNFAKLSKDIFFGGGALGIIGAIADKTADAVNEANKLALAYQRGESSAGEIVRTIAEGLPIMGSFTRLFDSIINATFRRGQFVEVESLNEQIKQTEILTKELEDQAETQRKLRDAEQKRMDQYLAFVNKRFDANAGFLSGFAEAVRTPAETLEMEMQKLERALSLGLDAGIGGRFREQIAENFRQSSGILQQWQDEWDAATAEIQDRWQRIGANASRWIDELKTPLERYAETVAELNELLAVGFLTQEQFNRAIAKAQSSLNPDVSRREGTFRQISLSRDAIGGMTLGGSGTQKVTDPQLAETNRLLKRIADQRGGVAVYG